MTQLKTLTILTASTLALFTTNAYADDKKPAAEAPKAAVTTTANTTVLASVRDSMIPVEGPDGQIYYNQFVPIDDLRDVSFDAEPVDSYRVEYEGRTYINRIMKETS